MTSTVACSIGCPVCGDPIEVHGTVTLGKRNPDTRTVHATITCDDAPLREHARAHNLIPEEEPRG